MGTRRWLLPESIEDALPPEAGRIEILRRALLDQFDRHGYDFVMPPLLEYVESIAAGGSHDLDLRTFKLVDQLSGRSMGLRADITPQVARIDAHPLGRPGVARLCYCGSVLHALPAGLNATREPLQIGAEVYGHAGLEADIEVVRLMADTMKLSGIGVARIDVGHVGIFRALARLAGLVPQAEEDLFDALQGKDVPLVRELVSACSDPPRSALLALPDLYGGAGMLDAAAKALPEVPEIRQALADLRRLAGALSGLPLSFDLADVRGYHYHTGLVFAAYCSGSPGAVALGGRYDGFGRVFGRARAATGFSTDLRELARLVPPVPTRSAVLAPWPDDDSLHAEVASLRAAGERVVLALPGHGEGAGESGCDRIMVRSGDTWIVESLKED